MERLKNIRLSEEHFFIASVFVVNGANYLYNMLLGRVLGPTEYADAALLVTMLLMLSFFATTFQIVSTKYSGELENEVLKKAQQFLLQSGFFLGIIIASIIFLSAGFLKESLNTFSANIFRIFALGIPIYFILSVNRGFHQGKQSFIKLSITYQSEVWVKLILTALLIYFSTLQSSISVSWAILASIVVAVFPWSYKEWKVFSGLDFRFAKNQNILRFFWVTISYEFTQILINNSDIILVKSFFSNTEAGLYASLALVGRLVYFMAWMFVMLLLPKVIQRKKNNQPTLVVLFEYMGIIAFFSGALILGTYLFPELIIQMMFGDAFLPIKNLLYLYAIATALFALGNIVVYYYLSLDKYLPVFVACLFGCLQILLVYWFHESLREVVLMQIYAMGGLLAILLGYLLYHEKIKA